MASNSAADNDWYQQQQLMLSRQQFAETQRQYNETKQKEADKKARDKANAGASHGSKVFAYSNNASAMNDLSQGAGPQSYSLLNMGGTAPVFTDLMSGAGMANKLGG